MALTDDQRARCAMTPEQENELVAKWMGWEWLGGNIQQWERNGVYTGSYPDYRTDPAMLWELIDKLIHCGWWTRELSGTTHVAIQGPKQPAFGYTLAEAVFAAAAMQATAEQGDAR